MMERMSAAEFACWRHLLGLTLDELAAALSVNPRTARSWESGRDAIPVRVAAELSALKAEHDRLVTAILDSDTAVEIARAKTADNPRGWKVAACARALQIEPELTVEWA